jgi:hypothetical protein
MNTRREFHAAAELTLDGVGRTDGRLELFSELTGHTGVAN